MRCALRPWVLPILLFFFSATPLAAAEAAPTQEAAFDILEYDVEGNSVLQARDIERAVNPYLGPGRHFADVEAARKALESVYQSAGYQTVFVEIPEQRIVEGVVHLRVVEGTVDRSSVVGSRYYELGQIKSQVPELAPGTVPNLNDLQEQLAQVNRTPDRQVAPIMRPGRTPGTVDVDLAVKDQLPLHGELELDNHNSAFTSPMRLNAALRYDNLWQADHSLGLNYQVSPQNHSEVDVLYATYLWKFKDIPDVVSLYGVRSNSNVAVLGSSTVLGKAKIAGIRWIHPFTPTGYTIAGWFHSLSFGFDRKDFGQTNLAVETGIPDILPPITYNPITLNYSGAWSGAYRQLQYSFGASSAPRGLFGNSDLEFAGRRVVASAGYLEWKYNASYEDRFSHHVAGFVRIDGQQTVDPLIPNEQYTAGGADSVRGYRESEVLGDRGVRSNVEFRFSPLAWTSVAEPRSLYALVFFDLGYLHTLDPLGPQLQQPVTVISSTGVGFRAVNWYGFKLDVDWAHALRNGARGVNGYITSKGDSRFDLSLDYSF